MQAFFLLCAKNLDSRYVYLFILPWGTSIPSSDWYFRKWYFCSLQLPKRIFTGCVTYSLASEDNCQMTTQPPDDSYTHGKISIELFNCDCFCSATARMQSSVSPDYPHQKETGHIFALRQLSANILNQPRHTKNDRKGAESSVTKFNSRPQKVKRWDFTSRKRRPHQSHKQDDTVPFHHFMWLCCKILCTCM